MSCILEVYWLYHYFTGTLDDYVNCWGNKNQFLKVFLTSKVMLGFKKMVQSKIDLGDWHIHKISMAKLEVHSFTTQDAREWWKSDLNGWVAQIRTLEFKCEVKSHTAILSCFWNSISTLTPLDVSLFSVLLT